MFHQSGGCCDGSVPLCFRLGEFRRRFARCVLFGVVEETPFYVGHSQAEYLSRTQLVLDVIPGDIDSFSLEAGTGVRFLCRGRRPVLWRRRRCRRALRRNGARALACARV